MRLKQTALVTALLLTAALAYANCGTCGTGGEESKKGKVETGKFLSIFSWGPEEAARINTAALAALIAAKVPMVIIDARSGKYDDGKRIPGAKSLNAGSTDEEIKALLPDKSALIITYCANLECPASHQLAEKLMKAGYVNLIEYPEGIEGWQKAGHKVEQAKK